MIIEGKKINIFGDTSCEVPIVYTHSVHGEGYKLWSACQKIDCPEFILVEVDGIIWNDDMTPWPIGKLFPEDEPCGGKAAEWLEVLTTKVIPEVEENLNITKRIIAGYSLAGLFSLWSAYNTDVFDAVVSGSGSYWYPDFLEYVKTHHFGKTPENIYFSLGDKERFSRVELFTHVEDNTRWLCDFYRQHDINTTFELNPGNHFQHGDTRMAKGIKWSLNQIE